MLLSFKIWHLRKGVGERQTSLYFCGYKHAQCFVPPCNKIIRSIDKSWKAFPSRQTQCHLNVLSKDIISQTVTTKEHSSIWLVSMLKIILCRDGTTISHQINWNRSHQWLVLSPLLRSLDKTPKDCYDSFSKQGKISCTPCCSVHFPLDWVWFTWAKGSVNLVGVVTCFGQCQRTRRQSIYAHKST